MLGTGTLAKELDEQLGAYDTVLAAVGGGGLIAGMATWYAGGKRVIGVEPEGAPTLTDALAAGRPVDAPTESIANDSLAPLQVGELVFPIARRYVDRVALVTDDDIRSAQASLWRNLTIVAEPGGAAAFAALLAKRYVPEPGERVVRRDQRRQQRRGVAMSVRRIAPGKRMSKAVVHGDTVYLSGHVAEGATVTEQTQSILARIEALLTEAGTDKSKLLSAQIWLADIATFDEMNAVWEAWIVPGRPPARATVESRLAGPEYLIEIAAIAAV